MRAKILVVDDEPPIRRLLRTSLTAEGFEVFEADRAHRSFGLSPARAHEVVASLSLLVVGGFAVAMIAAVTRSTGRTSWTPRARARSAVRGPWKFIPNSFALAKTWSVPLIATVPVPADMMAANAPLMLPVKVSLALVVAKVAALVKVMAEL